MLSGIRVARRVEPLTAIHTLDKIRQVLEAQRRPRPNAPREKRSGNGTRGALPMPSMARPGTPIRHSFTAPAEIAVGLVREIVEIACDRRNEIPVMQKRLQDNIERYVRYKDEARKIMEFPPGPDPFVVTSMAALQHLTGDARHVVLKFCTKDTLDELVSLDEVFDTLCEKNHIVVPEEYYLMLDMLGDDMWTKKTLKCKDVFKQLFVNPYEAVHHRDRLFGAVLCKEVQELRAAWDLLALQTNP
jgi:hypothetical protein